MNRLYRLPADEILDQMIVHAATAQWKEWSRIEREVFIGCGFMDRSPGDHEKKKLMVRAWILEKNNELEIQSTKANTISRIRLHIDQ